MEKKNTQVDTQVDTQLDIVDEYVLTDIQVKVLKCLFIESKRFTNAKNIHNQ